MERLLFDLIGEGIANGLDQEEENRTGGCRSLDEKLLMIKRKGRIQTLAGRRTGRLL